MHTVSRLCTLAVITGLVALTACGGDPAAPSSTSISSISVSPTSRALVLPVGDTRLILLAVDQPAGAPPATRSFESADISVATVTGSGDSVTVRGISEGTTTITVTAAASGSDGFAQTQRSGTVTVTVRSATDAARLGLGFGREQFVEIPAGSFQMGSTNGREDERPVRTVTISQPFLLQKTEVTQAQWQQVMLGTELENPSIFPACGATCPVEGISFNDIQRFLQRLNEQDQGKNYRLPTEAEWEYAARDTTTGDYGGNGVLNDMAWWGDNSQGRPQRVALKRPNAWGLYDMHGNVSESVSDWYQADYYATAPALDPKGSNTGNVRGQRGGSWLSPADGVRSAHRSFGVTLGLRCGNCGFRLARAP